VSQSPAQLDAIRRAMEATMPDRCTVRRSTTTKDSGGSWTTAPTVIASDVPCEVYAGGRSPNERMLGGRMQSQSDYTISLSLYSTRWPGGSIDLYATDELLVTGGAAGTYGPVSTGGPTSEELSRQVPANLIS